MYIFNINELFNKTFNENNHWRQFIKFPLPNINNVSVVNIVNSRTVWKLLYLSDNYNHGDKIYLSIILGNLFVLPRFYS